VSDLHLNAGTAIDERLFLDESSDDTEGVVKGPACLVEKKLVAASEEDGHGLALVGAASHLDDFGGTTGADLLDEVSATELLGLKLVDVSNGGGSDSLGDEFNIIALNVLDDHNLLLGEEMESEVVDGLSQHALLEKNNIGTGSNDFLDYAKDVLALFLDDSIHGSIVADNNVGLHIRLGCADRELDKSDLGVLNPGGATSKVRSLLVNEAEAINKLRLIDGTAELLADVNVAQVDVNGRVLVNALHHSVDSHRGEEGVVMGDDLGGERGDSVLDKSLAVVEIDWLGHLIDDLHSLLVGDLETIRDGSRVETLTHELSASLEKSASHDDNGGGTVTSLNVLGLGDFDEHSRGGVDDLHLLEDSGTIVGDEDLTLGGLDHFVHATGAERSPDDISDGLGGDDVGLADILRLLGTESSCFNL